MNSKGISPIIASVLLLAVALSVVGIFSGWAPELATDVTDETENTTMETINCNEAQINLQSAFFNNSDQGVTNYTIVTVQNQGPMNLTEVSIVAYDSNDRVLEQSSDLSYDASTLVNETNISGINEKPAYLEAYSGRCSDVTSRLEERDINT